MSTSFLNRDINWSAIGKNTNLNPAIRKHLTNVYSTLALTVLASAIGSLVFMYTHAVGGLLTIIAVFGLLIWLHSTPVHEVNTRMMILLAFGFFQGCGLGPLLESVLDIDPSIVASAFLGTTCIFACFSGSALLAERRSYLYLGGLLSSGLSMLFMMSLFNLFFRIPMIASVQVYMGLLVFCGFIMFDTQLIVEKAANGSKDFVGHALELFLDFINVFVRLLIILTKNKKENKKR